MGRPDSSIASRVTPQWVCDAGAWTGVIASQTIPVLAIAPMVVVVLGTIGLTGTLAGLLFGLVFCLNIETIQRLVEWVTGVQVFNADVYFLSHVPAKVDWVEVAGVSIWALAASFLFTLLPAWRASRLDPVEALRYE